MSLRLGIRSSRYPSQHRHNIRLALASVSFLELRPSRRRKIFLGKLHFGDALQILCRGKFLERPQYRHSNRYAAKLLVKMFNAFFFEEKVHLHKTQ